MILFITTLGMLVMLVTIVLIFKHPHLALAPILLGHVFALVTTRYTGLGHGAMYLMLGILLYGLSVYSWRNRGTLWRFSFPEVLLYVIGLIALASIAWTTAPKYGAEKTLRFFGWALPLLFGARVFTSTREDTEKLLRLLSTFAAITMFFYTLLYFTVGQLLMFGDRFSGLGLSWTAALSLALCAHGVFYGGLFRKMFLGAAVFCGMLMMAASGGRGAFFGIFIAAGLTFLNRRGIIRMAVVGAVLLIAGYFVETYLISQAMQQRLSLENISAASRTPLWWAGLDQMASHLLAGGGIGSFAHYFFHRDVPGWPHNTWLEIGGELGAITLLLALIVAFNSFRTVLMLRRVPKGPLVGTAKVLQFVFWVGVLRTFSSGDLPSQDGFFVIVGMLGAVRRWLPAAIEEQHWMQYGWAPANEEAWQYYPQLQPGEA